MGGTVDLLLWERQSVCCYERDSRSVAMGVCGKARAGFLRDGLLDV